MPPSPLAAASLLQIHSKPGQSRHPIDPTRLMDMLGMSGKGASTWLERLPFSPADTTAGTETELQTAVLGSRQNVDLARAIEESTYYKNLARRAASGDASSRLIAELEDYLNATEQIWENSWVHFPRRTLNPFAESVFVSDMRADKRVANGPSRCDVGCFAYTEAGESRIRVPVSYMLKLSLANAVGRPGVHPMVRATGIAMMEHFLNDNTSPETHSYHPVGQGQNQRVGTVAAKETLMRYLLTQLMTQYANRRFELEANGQAVVVYFSPTPPVRQKRLNDLISDAFYRKLFMSPCLSGWHRGEDKHRYMALCHEVLSRSQLNALGKLKEAGIISNNLVVLPNTSNVCLSNNGTHLSLGSRSLTDLMGDPASGYGEVEEKYYGDLVIKISEHFLPLFVGTYSAAPYRFDFWDFHPERALGFLPHELDYTHLRMLWRRWKGKARIKCFGRPITPFGPEWIDRAVSRIMGLKGDFVADFRLIDYLVALLSTDENPALDGRSGNDHRLLADLENMGTFHQAMPLYLPYRLRQYGQIGFSGYEARYFSLFENVVRDMGNAADLQLLVTMLAYKCILFQSSTHAMIPDSPTVESERRQFFFGAAIGIPTFYVDKNSPNHFLMKIVRSAHRTRSSRRYPNYIRITAREYQLALIRMLRQEAGDLIELMQLNDVMDDLELRVNDPENHSCAGRLTKGILDTGGWPDPFKGEGRAFNQEAETYYRDTLRRQHIQEAFAHFSVAVRELDSWASWRSGQHNQALLSILGGKNADDYLVSAKRAVLADDLSEEMCENLIYLILLLMHKSRSESP
ncbi:MAG: hypothetical protein PVI54_19625 [Desulfobacteraceae bacterium]